MKHDLGPVYMEKNWDHYTFLENESDVLENLSMGER